MILIYNKYFLLLHLKVTKSQVTLLASIYRILLHGIFYMKLQKKYWKLPVFSSDLSKLSEMESAYG